MNIFIRLRNSDMKKQIGKRQKTKTSYAWHVIELQGDGTTSVVLFTGELLAQAARFIDEVDTSRDIVG